MMSRTAASDIVAALEANGTEYIFGVPGDTSLALYDALRESQKITHVMARDERGAAYMADVYARVSGKPGVCEAPSGAGALYLLPGIAESNASSVSVLALTTDIPLSGSGKNILTEMDQVGLFSSVTKWSTKLRTPTRAVELVRKAFRVATTGRPGAVHLSLPEDILAMNTDGAPEPYGVTTTATFPAYRSGADLDQVRQIANLMVEAQRPVIVAGGGTRISGAWDALTEVAELSGAMVATSITGKGSIDETHPNSLGVVGGNGSRPFANQAVADSDLVVFLGCKTDSVTTMKWTLPALATARVVQVDVDPKELGVNYPLLVGACSDARTFLESLITVLREIPDHSSTPWFDVTGSRARWLESHGTRLRSDSIPINPYRVIDALGRLLPRDSTIVADAGTGTPLTAAMYSSPAGRNIIIPRGYGGLGYALPGTVGAHYARPDHQVVGIIGDGSFGMSTGDLETISRLQLPILLVQFNNATFGWIKALQRFHRDKRYFGVDFSTDTDYVAIAKGFGIDGMRVEHPDDIESAIKNGLSEQRPYFIDIVTQSEEEEPPPVPDWF